MKTSNKTNSRFPGIAVAIMVMSLVTVNLTAQKSFNDNSLAYYGKQFFTNSKNEIINAVSETKSLLLEKDEENLEDWMTKPAEWNASSAITLEDGISFEEDEMILEDWMQSPVDWTRFEAPVEEVDFEECEMILEDWMMKANWTDRFYPEDELQLESWMNEPASW